MNGATSSFLVLNDSIGLTRPKLAKMKEGIQLGSQREFLRTG